MDRESDFLSDVFKIALGIVLGGIILWICSESYARYRINQAVSYWTPTNVDCGSRQPAARRLDAHQRNGWTFLNGSGWTFMGRPFWTSSKSLVPESAVPQPP